jgi:predicted lysophospholipase L1 biosynthesis ABC-type transport system permease subunit
MFCRFIKNYNFVIQSSFYGDKKLSRRLIHIRSMMERSSRFISLSGLSGVVAGLAAIIGATYVYFVFKEKASAILMETGIYLVRLWSENWYGLGSLF